MILLQTQLNFFKKTWNGICNPFYFHNVKDLQVKQKSQTVLNESLQMASKLIYFYCSNFH